MATVKCRPERKEKEAPKTKAVKAHKRSAPKPIQDDPEFNYLFDSDDAPYRDFAGRIRLARALGIMSVEEYGQTC